MKKFHLITRAVILEGNYVLLAHEIGADNTFLPGGHIEYGESAITALNREIFEEIGVASQVEEYLGAIEGSWLDGVVTHFEINHIFKVKIDNISINSKLESREGHLEFFWSSIDDLDKNNLLPHTLIKRIIKFANGDNSVWWESSL